MPVGYSHITGGFPGGQAQYVRVLWGEAFPAPMCSSQTAEGCQIALLQDVNAGPPCKALSCGWLHACHDAASEWLVVLLGRLTIDKRPLTRTHTFWTTVGLDRGAAVHAADVNLLKVPEGMDDKKVVLLSDIMPTGWHGAVLANVEKGSRVAVWGCGPGAHNCSACMRGKAYTRCIRLESYGGTALVISHSA